METLLFPCIVPEFHRINLLFHPIADRGYALVQRIGRGPSRRPDRRPGSPKHAAFRRRGCLPEGLEPRPQTSQARRLAPQLGLSKERSTPPVSLRGVTTAQGLGVQLSICSAATRGFTSSLNDCFWRAQSGRAIRNVYQCCEFAAHGQNRQ